MSKRKMGRSGAMASRSAADSTPPVGFWGDEDGARYREAYFEHYPGAWRHGDWIKFNERGGCVIYGRSDSTINRQGVRMMARIRESDAVAGF